jgi:hypothetical protein
LKYGRSDKGRPRPRSLNAPRISACVHAYVFRQAGYTVVELCARQNAAALEKRLSGQRSILIGQSGMGKSTLINRLVPDADAATREISAALDSGKHTTTLSRVYSRPDGSQIIDSPGPQVFGLAHLTRQQVEHAFIEFRPYTSPPATRISVDPAEIENHGTGKSPRFGNPSRQRRAVPKFTPTAADRPPQRLPPFPGEAGR